MPVLILHEVLNTVFGRSFDGFFFLFLYIAPDLHLTGAVCFLKRAALPLPLYRLNDWDQKKAGLLCTCVITRGSAISCITV